MSFVCTKDNPWNPSKALQAIHPDEVRFGQLMDIKASDLIVLRCPYCHARRRVVSVESADLNASTPRSECVADVATTDGAPNLKERRGRGARRVARAGKRGTTDDRA